MPAAPATPARRRGRPGHARADVLAAAIAVFTERGYDGTSMEDIARRLGVSKSAIYHHVSGKDDLLRHALDDALDGLERAASDARRSEGRALDRLARLVHDSVVVLVDRLPSVTLLLRVHGTSDVERAALARRRRIDRLAAELVTEAQADGDLRADLDPLVATRLVFGTVNSLVEWVRPGRDAPTLAAAVVTQVLRGLTP